VTAVAIGNPSGKCAKLHIEAAINNRDHASQSLLSLLVRATYIHHCSSRTSRSWWITHFNATPPERLQQS